MGNNKLQQQRQLLVDAKSKGKLAQLGAFVKLSGPGWLQSATTLGGGSLASALYLGVLGGLGFMWLQPFAMILGIIMLAALSYVTLSIKEKPMVAINKNITPILGYAWAIGSMLACFVFAWPQFALGVAAITQNIANMGSAPSQTTEIIITACLFSVAMLMTIIYAQGGKGVKIFEIFIKLSVAAIVVCFFGVVISLTVSGKIDWARVAQGFVPNFSVFTQPSTDFMAYISKLDVAGAKFWSDMIVSQQIDVVISAAAMAVGINMTFLWPYSMIKKGWNKDFRGLAIFDLATGLFIPFLLATSCIVIAASSQFHATPAQGLAISTIKDGKLVPAIVNGVEVKPAQNLVSGYIQLLDARIENKMGKEAFAKLTPTLKDNARNTLSAPEKDMAAMLVKRDASNLSETLVPLVGDDVARYIFGFGVLGMAMNAVLMNMLICGVSFSEIFNKGGKPKWQVVGSSLILISATASIFFKGARMWLVIYAGVMAAVLLPIAYGAFLLLMNSKKVLGDEAPKGKSRMLWNALMICSVGASSIASLWVLYQKIGIAGPIAFAVFFAIVIVSALIFKSKKQ